MRGVALDHSGLVRILGAQPVDHPRRCEYFGDLRREEVQHGLRARAPAEEVRQDDEPALAKSVRELVAEHLKGLGDRAD